MRSACALVFSTFAVVFSLLATLPAWAGPACTAVWSEELNSAGGFSDGLTGNTNPASIPLTPHHTYNSHLPSKLTQPEYQRRNVTMRGKTTVETNDTVRVHVTGSLTIASKAKVNWNKGDPSKLVILVNGPVTIGANAEIRGFIYATGAVQLGHGVKLHGSISTDSTISGHTPSITFDSSWVPDTDFGEHCEQTPPPSHLPQCEDVWDSAPNFKAPPAEKIDLPSNQGRKKLDYDGGLAIIGYGPFEGVWPITDEQGYLNYHFKDGKFKNGSIINVARGRRVRLHFYEKLEIEEFVTLNPLGSPDQLVIFVTAKNKNDESLKLKHSVLINGYLYNTGKAKLEADGGGPIIINGGLTSEGSVKRKGSVYINYEGGPLSDAPLGDVCDNGETPVLPGEVDHYRAYYQKSGLSCEARDIRFVACADADCSERYQDQVTLQLSPEDDWESGSNQLQFSGGETAPAPQLWQPPGTVTLGLQQASPAAVASSALQCFSEQADGQTQPDDCRLEFTQAGFRISVPDMVGCHETTATIEAVTADSTGRQCVRFLSDSQQVQASVSYQTEMVGQPELLMTTEAQEQSLVPGVEQLMDLDFGSQGVADFSLRFDDAGLLQLSITHPDPRAAISGDVVVTSRPLRLQLSSLDVGQCTDIAQCDASAVAGESFGLEVKALCDAEADTTTPSFKLDSVTLAHDLVQALPESIYTKGELVDDTFSFPQGGRVVHRPAISEAGVFDLTLPDTAYLGGAVAGSQLKNLGRFRPAQFIVTGMPGQVTPACSERFTYLGQPFGYDPGQAPQVFLQAVNSLGEPTLNYRGNLVRPFVDNGSVEPLRPASLAVYQPAHIITEKAGNGRVARLVDQLQWVLQRGALVEPMEYALDFALPAAALTDTDGVCLGTAPHCAGVEFLGQSSGEQRYGRAKLEDVFGAENQTLPLALQAEYFDGQRFVLNSQDHCSVNTAEVTDLLPAPSADGFFVQVNSQGANLLAGRGNLWLSAISDVNSGPGASGQVRLQYPADATPWLQFDWNGDGTETNPTATATFGRYRGNDRVIWRREVFN